MDISIILPIYNERDNIEPLLDEIQAALEPTGKSYEIIAVDDGSRDGSTQILRDLATPEVPGDPATKKRPRLKAVFFRRNFGQTAAFDAGFRNATGDVLVTMDADRQNDPADIPRLLAKLDSGFDVVTGWRKARQDGMVLRKIPSKIANAIIRRVTGTQIHDLGCSLKVYRRSITDEMRLYGEMHRFISVIADTLGARVGEEVVNHRARVAGVSKYGLARTVKVILDLLTIVFFKKYQAKPIYLFGGIGMSSIGIGAVCFLVVLYEKIAEGIWVHRNPLFLIAITCALVGVQFLGMGLLAEILVRTYFEAQNKTAYSIASRAGFEGDPPRASAVPSATASFAAALS